MTLSLKARQALAILAGIVVAIGMMGLGLWQMRSYEESTRDVSAERAAQPSVPLADSVDADGTIADIYGRRVTLSGEYAPQFQTTVGESDPWRVATAFRMDDGRYLVIVRGSVAPDAAVPSAPTGHQSVEGIFLASDKPSAGDATRVAEQPTLRIQELAQDWPSPLIAGYVTLPEDDSKAQGLGKAALTLPEAEGSATHRGYALQWWVFAAGAVAAGVYGARTLGRDEAKRQEKAQA